MDRILLAVALFLFLTLAASLLRILRGPTPGDRMLAGQLFGTTGVAVLIVLAQTTGRAALRDVALVFVLLGVVAVVAFVRRAWQPVDAGAEEPR
jgi:multicomponent Na+:H+ antiporter subunit F